MRQTVSMASPNSPFVSVTNKTACGSRPQCRTNPGRVADRLGPQVVNLGGIQPTTRVQSLANV